MHRVIAAVVAIVVKDDRILAMRRAPEKVGAGLWEAVSGRIEPDEQPADAALREIGEETALEVELDPVPVDAYLASRAGEPMLVVVYVARWRGGEVRRSEEHDQHLFCTPAEFRERSSLARLADAVDRANARLRGAP